MKPNMAANETAASETERRLIQAARRCAADGCEAESELNGSRRFCRTHREAREKRLKVADACLTLLRAEFILDREYYSFLSRIDRDFPNFEIKPGPAGRMEDA